MKKQFFSKAYLMMVLTGSVLLVTSCGGKKGSMPQSNEYPVAKVAADSVEMKSVYPAVICGKQDIEIRPKIAGFITKLCVDEGSVVRQGQPLFLIDNVQYREAVNQAEASLNTTTAALATAELTYNNKKELYSQNIIGDYDLQTAQNALAQAQAAKATAQAALTAAKQNLAYCTVTSPSNGVVGTIPYRVGSLVSSSTIQPLTTVSNIEEMYVYFSMTEKQLLEMSRAGGKNLIEAFPEVGLQLADGSMYEEKGHVSTVSGVIDQSTGSVSVRADFKNPSHLLKSGGTGSIVITKEAKDAIIIPQSATVEVQNKIFVYVLGNDKKVKYTEIKVDPQNDGLNYIVKEGLSMGDTYVLSGITKLTDGTEIVPLTMEEYQKKIEESQKLGAIQGNYKEMKKAFSSK